MSFSGANLVLLAHGGGKYIFGYTTTDSMASVAAVGYFNNLTNQTNLQASATAGGAEAWPSEIWCWCGDGHIVLQVVSIASGAVTTAPISSDLGVYGGVVGTATATVGGGLPVYGFYELGTGTATAYKLLDVLPGVPIQITQMGTATGGITVTVSSATANGAQTLNGAGNTIITFTGKGQAITLQGVSLTRWAVVGFSGVALS